MILFLLLSEQGEVEDKFVPLLLLLSHLALTHHCQQSKNSRRNRISLVSLAPSWASSVLMKSVPSHRDLHKQKVSMRSFIVVVRWFINLLDVFFLFLIFVVLS